MTTTTQTSDAFGFSSVCSVCVVRLDEQNTHPVSGDVIAYCIPCAEKRIATDSLALFFEQVARIAEQRVAAKKAAATAKKQSNLTILGRCQFKSHGAVLIGIEDRNNDQTGVRHVTICAGNVLSCVHPVTGEACSGQRWSGRCRHGDRAMSYESSRTAVQATTHEPVMIESDLSVHVEDSIASGEFADMPLVAGSCDLCGRWSKRAVCHECSGAGVAA